MRLVCDRNYIWMCFSKVPYNAIPGFHHRGHGFDSWMGKFGILLDAAKKKRKKKKKLNVPGGPVVEIPGKHSIGNQHAVSP